jgi:hypothetical protein
MDISWLLPGFNSSEKVDSSQLTVNSKPETRWAMLSRAFLAVDCGLSTVSFHSIARQFLRGIKNFLCIR